MPKYKVFITKETDGEMVIEASSRQDAMERFNTGNIPGNASIQWEEISTALHAHDAQLLEEKTY